MIGGFGDAQGSKTDSATVSAYIAGAIAAIGWWCWIDAVVYNGVACENTCTPAQLATCTAKSIEFAYWLPGIFALLATVMINCFNYNAYAPSAAGDGGQALACNNAWLFFSFLVMFGTIIAAVWILVDGWTTKSVGCEEDKIVTIWPGIAMVIQTACMLISSVVMFIGREQGSPASSVGMF